MTTWLDWRTEPVSEVPEVRVIAPSFGSGGYLVECLDLQCGFNDVAADSIAAEVLKTDHEDWHENGMPE